MENNRPLNSDLWVFDLQQLWPSRETILSLQNMDSVSRPLANTLKPWFKKLFASLIKMKTSKCGMFHSTCKCFCKIYFLQFLKDNFFQKHLKTFFFPQVLHQKCGFYHGGFVIIIFWYNLQFRNKYISIEMNTVWRYKNMLHHPSHL